MDIKYSYGPVPTVRKFSQSDAFIRGLMGPFGSGKSSGCVFEILRRAQRQAPGRDGIRHTRWCVIRNTLPQLKDTTIRTFQEWIPPNLFGEWRVQDQQYIIKSLPGCEIDVLFRAMDRPDQVANLLSLELTGAWVNEAREVPWSIIEALQGRVGRFPAMRDGGTTWDGIWMDTNPPDTDSKWYRFFEEWPQSVDGAEEMARYKAKYGRPFAEIFKQPSGRGETAENLSNLKDGYYDGLASGKSREWVRIYVDGDYGFVVDGKPVFPEYIDSVHCSDAVKPVRNEPIYVGIDFGLTPAAVFVQLNSFGQLLVHDEVVADNMGIDAFADELTQHIGREWNAKKIGWKPEFLYVGDPAGQQRVQTDEKTCFQILGAHGMEIEPGLQDLTIRLESVRKPLTTVRGRDTKTNTQRSGFLMHPRCKTLRKAMLGGYQLRRLNTSREKYTEKPDKNASSHIADALEYACTVLFGSALTQEKPRESRRGTDEDWFTGEDSGAGRDPQTGY